MARPRMLDYLQSYPFWVVDVSPNLNPPFFVFNPTMGFSGCSGLGIELTVEEYRPLNSMYPVNLPGEASVPPVTLARGARFYDSDFYRWIDRAIKGTDRFRRNLLVLHLVGANVDTVRGFGMGGEYALQMAAAGGTSAALAGAAALMDVLPFKESARVPGRVWVLWDCIPTSYRPGDMDATSGDVTIQELEIQPRVITECALGSVL